MADKDFFKVIRDMKGIIKAEIDKIKARFRRSFIGRLIWAIGNANKDFKTVLPAIKFILTTEQAELVKKLMCDDDLRLIQGMNAFYRTYPRKIFNLAKQDLEVYEAAELANTAMEMLTPPEIRDGKKYYSKDNPFIQMMKREYDDQTRAGVKYGR